jgi:hypothetical protein
MGDHLRKVRLDRGTPVAGGGARGVKPLRRITANKKWVLAADILHSY